ncbi:hypothetical protein BDA99DRAFT_537504 [Phascolomyces articulosus]|uniref:RING-type domain-containing protein n=1 Tax=Phascolomyces articulosus TaxID=60185 RepID=A0AAD5PDU6_9FUNG|nr:hypothetical protein BDA99DRAFT_537504 [Phascolomyces articulosus]
MLFHVGTKMCPHNLNLHNTWRSTMLFTRNKESLIHYAADETVEPNPIPTEPIQQQQQQRIDTMGNNTSRDSGNTSRRSNGRSSKQTTIQEYVDYGTTLPNGLYTAQQDYNIKNVRKLIRERKISPFYKGLSDPPEPQPEVSKSPPLPPTTTATTNNANRSRNNSVVQEDQKNKTLYNNPVECPICFLYYPSNINHSRCCDQPICTECFLQIKRPIETPSLPAACPFCMEDNFGVIYEAPAWSDRSRSCSSSSSSSPQSSSPTNRSKVSPRHTTTGVSDGMIPRRKSINHNDPNVVLVDHVRPNWREAPVRTGRSRHNSESRGSDGTGNRNNNGFLRGASPLFTRPGRSASSAAHSDYHHYLAAMRDMNLDLEEYMVMEAIRMSLADQEQQQEGENQQSEENNNNTNEGDGDNNNNNNNNNSNNGDGQEQQHRQSPPITENNNNPTPLLTTSPTSSNASP